MIVLRVMGGIYGERRLACKRDELSRKAMMGANPANRRFADRLALMGIWRPDAGSKSRTYFDPGWLRTLLCECTANNAVAA
jgi:hypothetical protein